MRNNHRSPVKDRKAKLVPTLDGDGWMQHGTEMKLDRLLANFFTSDSSQSSLYYRRFSTFQTTLAEAIDNPTKLREDLYTYLSSYLNKYLTDVEIDVYLTDTKDTPIEPHDIHGSFGVHLTVTFSDDGKYRRAERELRYKDGVFHYVLEKFNLGI